MPSFLFHELRAHNDYQRLGGTLQFWRTPGGTEVDFVWTRGGERVAIEVKSTPRWKAEFGNGILSLAEHTKLTRAFGVYLGQERQKHGALHILPLAAFLEELYAGRVL